jgi:nucleoid DNA-binding protein
MIGRKTYLNALKDGLPQLVKDDATAEEILDIVFSVPVKALENGDSVELPNLGHISIDKSRGEECLCYNPLNSLVKCVLK